MSVNFFKKSIGNLLEIALVVGVVLTIFLINPWNIFGGGIKLNPTANNVSAIRELGQLVTAEYYGETIASFDKSKINFIEEDNISNQADWLFEQMKREIFFLYVEELFRLDSLNKLDDKKFRLFRFFKKNKDEKIIEQDLISQLSLKDEPLFGEVIEFYWLYKNQSSGFRNKKYDSKYESKAIISLGNEVNAKFNALNEFEFEEYIQSGLPSFNNTFFSDFYYNKQRKINAKELKKKELVMIGRGWVKAGFDFGRLDKSNFMFDENNGVVHIFGVNAEILNAEINPWFIPEKKVPGFQIISANKNVDFYDAKQVKMYCIEKLRRMAIDAGILAQAEKQGKESIKNLITLVTGVEVKEVYFHYDLFSVNIKEIMKDEFISTEEAKALDILINQQIDTIVMLENAAKNHTQNQQIKNIKINQLKLTIENLKKCNYEGNGHYNRLAYTKYKFTVDSLLTENEIKQLAVLKWDLESTFKNKPYRRNVENQVWYDNDLQFINEYNSAFHFIESNTQRANLVDMVVDTTYWNNTLKKKFNDTGLFDFQVRNDSAYITFIEEIKDSSTFSQLKYPFSTPKNIETAFSYNKALFSKIKKKDKHEKPDTIHVQLGKELNTQIAEKNSDTENTYAVIALQEPYKIDSLSMVVNNESLLILNEILNAYIKSVPKNIFQKFTAGLEELSTD